MNIRNITLYVLATALMGGLVFPEFYLFFLAWAHHGTGNPVIFWAYAMAFVIPAVVTYYLIKKTGIAWWYPSLVLTVPLFLWAESVDGPVVLSLFLSFLLLTTGWAAHDNRQKIYENARKANGIQPPLRHVPYGKGVSKKEIKENIKKYGWDLFFIFDPDGEHEAFLHTIGFEESYGHPEIVIFGLDKKKSQKILCDFSKYIKSSITLQTNQKIGNIVGDGYEVMFKPITAKGCKEYLSAASDYYNKPFRAQVMFWPDKANILPTEEGCEVTTQDEALAIV